MTWNRLHGRYVLRFQSTFDFPSWTFIPSPHASGEAFVFHKKASEGAPPMITLARVDADTGWFGLLRSPRRVDHVRLQELQIRISRGVGSSNEDRKHGGSNESEPKPRIIMGEIVADGTLLEILPKTGAKPPLRFDIYKLKLDSVGVQQPMRYHAQLRNAKPPGLIRAEGEFGPWHARDPGKTPVTGEYRFSDADLGVFHGIRGRLSSTGKFYGPLEKLEVSGQTETPNFTVTAGEHPMDLRTTFSATVDGTDGDTYLHPVTAKFGNTTVVAQGKIEGTPGVHGKTVSLYATVRDGDLADILRIGLKSDPPPMTGRISFHAKIQIPPGEQDIISKLRLDGAFDITAGKLTSSKLERKVSELSERGRGNAEGNGTSDVASDFRGKFKLDEGTLTLTSLTFHVPGATIRLDGTYGILTEALNFHGTATMEAKLSEMTTGIRSFLLKALDPIFHKDKVGTVIPIHIGGTRRDPSFGLDLK